MNLYSEKTKKESRGDTAIITVFISIAVLLTGAITLATISIISSRSTRDIAGSSQAIYAADTGFEYARYCFEWQDWAPGPSQGTPPEICTKDNDDTNGCENFTGAQLIAGENTTYDVAVANNLVNATNGPVGDEDSNCPLIGAVQNGSEDLCISAWGVSPNGARRRIDSDTNPDCRI